MKKQEVVTFKIDENLLNIIKIIPNRSEFIRKAILSAIGNACPLCNGSGTLSPQQKQHWDEFSLTHPVKECDDCHELYVSCTNGE